MTCLMVTFYVPLNHLKVCPVSGTHLTDSSLTPTVVLSSKENTFLILTTLIIVHTDRTKNFCDLPGIKFNWKSPFQWKSSYIIWCGKMSQQMFFWVRFFSHLISNNSTVIEAIHTCRVNTVTKLVFLWQLQLCVRNLVCTDRECWNFENKSYLKRMPPVEYI